MEEAVRQCAAVVATMIPTLEIFRQFILEELDAAQYGNQLNHFLKNVAIIGGLLYVAALGAGSASVDGRYARS